MNLPLGYAKLYELVGRKLPPPRCPAQIASSVNKRLDTEDRVLFPRGVAIEDSLAGHVEFALRHESMNLPLLGAALEQVTQDEMRERLKASPNGEYVRRMAYLWEWLSGRELDAGVRPSAAYVPLLEPEKYLVVENPQRHSNLRIFENQLGNREFSPTVRRTQQTQGGKQLLESLVRELQNSLQGERGSDLYQRAVRYIYLSETRSSFEIEKEVPASSKEQAFVKLLAKVGEEQELNEDFLIELQNLAVRNEFSREFTFRAQQNWLDRDASAIDYFPPAPEHVRPLMEGIMSFANDKAHHVDPIAKAALVSFGFVYIHPFMDGNGRLHRFLLHHVLASSGLVPNGLVMPISAVLSKNLDRYVATLTSFSKPVTKLWEYRREDERPTVVSQPGRTPYAYWDATLEVELTSWALTQAVRVEVPKEVEFLSNLDQARELINAEMDMPSKDITLLARFALQNGGKLSNNRRKQFSNLPNEKLDRIEAIISALLEENSSAK
jgi:hypothetical protein